MRFVRKPFLLLADIVLQLRLPSWRMRVLWHFHLFDVLTLSYPAFYCNIILLHIVLSMKILCFLWDVMSISKKTSVGCEGITFKIELIEYFCFCPWAYEYTMPVSSPWQHSQETDIHGTGGIRTRDPKKRAAAGSGLWSRNLSFSCIIFVMGEGWIVFSGWGVLKRRTLYRAVETICCKSLVAGRSFII